MTAYAHSLENQAVAAWQPLITHLLAVAVLTREFAQGFGLNDPAVNDEAFLVGLLHDLGKYRSAFQSYLRGERAGDAETRHAIYGGTYAFASEQLGAAFAIAGHHAGLHDLYDLTDRVAKAEEKENFAALAGLLEIEYPAARAFLIANAPSKQFAVLLEKELPTRLPLFPGVAAHLARLAEKSEDKFVLATELYTRMLFSCLVDADRLDSAYWSKPGIGTIQLAESETPLDAEHLLSLVVAERDRLIRCAKPYFRRLPRHRYATPWFFLAHCAHRRRQDAFCHGLRLSPCQGKQASPGYCGHSLSVDHRAERRRIPPYPGSKKQGDCPGKSFLSETSRQFK